MHWASKDLPALNLLPCVQGGSNEVAEFVAA
jgi:hypothetical protein